MCTLVMHHKSSTTKVVLTVIWNKIQLIELTCKDIQVTRRCIQHLFNRGFKMILSRRLYKAKVGGRDCGGWRAAKAWVFMLGGSGGMLPRENFAQIEFKWLIFRHGDNFKRDFYGLNIHWKRLPQTPQPNISFSNTGLVMLIHEFHCNFHQQNLVQLNVTK